MEKAAESGQTCTIACGLNPGHSATLWKGEEGAKWVGFVEPSWILLMYYLVVWGASGAGTQAAQ
eukprot:14035522-Ditylum_brightwellii.AAC.1